MEYHLPGGYEYKCVDSDVTDECLLYIKEITDKDQAFVWLEKFSFQTKTTWRTRRTFPKSGRVYKFKIDFRCARATDRRCKGARTSKHTGCIATLQIKIKKFEENAVANRKDLNRDWPTTIIFRGVHNHDLNSAESLKYRDLSNNSVAKLKELFLKGHSPPSALEILKTELFFEFAGKYWEIEKDGFYIPTYSKVNKLYEKECISKADSSKDEKFQCLQKQLDIYNSTSGGIAKFYKTLNNKHCFVIICSPTMKRVHQVTSLTSKLVLVYGLGGKLFWGNKKLRMYVFVNPTAAGGLPLSLVIANGKEECVFDEALSKLKDIFSENSIFGKKDPKIFITGSDLKERELLKKHFPNTKLLLCQFYFLKTFWSWLCSDKHGIIDPSHRQEIYNRVKNVLYAKTEEDADFCHLEIISSEVCKKYDNFLLHYLDLWKCKDEWASYCRQNLLLSENNTTNYVEILFRTLRDCILNRIMTFDLSQSVDYILTQYETYLKKRLIDFCNGRCSKAVLEYFLPSFNHTLYSFQKGSLNDTFLVKNISTNSTYHVDLSNGTCSCMIWLTGKVCNHFSFVMCNIHNVIERASKSATAETKRNMLYIATGRESSLNYKYLNDNCLSVFTHESGKHKLSDSNDKDEDETHVNDTDEDVNDTVEEETHIYDTHEDIDDTDEDETHVNDTDEDINDTVEEETHIYDTHGDIDNTNENETHVFDAHEDIDDTDENETYLNNADENVTNMDEFEMHINGADDNVTVKYENNTDKDQLADVKHSQSYMVAHTFSHNNAAPSSKPDTDNFLIFSDDETVEFTNIINRITDGLETKPKLFVPAVKKMLENAKKYASTEIGLLTAMHTFGTYNGILTNNYFKLIKRRSVVGIGDQPAAIKRKYKNLATKKNCVKRARKETCKKHSSK